MSASRTFAPLKTSAFISGDDWDHLIAEPARNNDDIAGYLAGANMELGGDERGILSSSFVAVNGRRRHLLNGDSVGGLTLEAVVTVYTADASTTVDARIRNVTDSSNAGAVSDAGALGSPSASTTPVDVVIPLTLASGAKSYELQVKGSDAANPVYAWGYLRLRRVPA